MSRSSSSRLRLAIAQLNPSVGDLKGNVALITQAHDKARAQGADLLITAEMALTGYQLFDMVFNQGFMEDVAQAVQELAQITEHGPAILVGAPRLAPEEAVGSDYGAASLRLRGRLYNSLYLLDKGKVAAVQDKVRLPTYGVFDELRNFTPGVCPPPPMEFGGLRLGTMICEDAWHADYAAMIADQGIDIMIATNGSVFAPSLPQQRQAMATKRVQDHGCPFIYTNIVGGQDRLVFDGGSFAMNQDGSLAASLAYFQSDFALLELDVAGQLSSQHHHATPTAQDMLYQAMMLGLKDYLRKSGFSKVMLGLSGGIDSALTAVLAVDALGADNVAAYMLPSPYTSKESLEDAEALADRLGIALGSISIQPAMAAFEAMLAPHFAGRLVDETEENIQSRARGVALMALSNKLGHLLLTTGNKSEVAVGYATLYGDMCGALNLIGDLYKTQVFAISEWRNAHHPAGALGPKGAVMPKRIITKPPSAELRPDQRDQDSLPPYEELDAILYGLVEQEAAPSSLIAQGHAPDSVHRVMGLLKRAEFKRQQAAPIIKVSERAFNTDRQYPICNGYTPR